jgi:acetyltransferase-like isoleucine patch superfamily enzyme
MLFFNSLVIAFLPSPIKIWVFRKMGWKIGRQCYIGFSLVQASKATMGDNVYIGHFNVIWRLKTLSMGSGSRITLKNWITGARKGTFAIGKNSSMSGRHFLDASADIIIGSNTIIAGRESQFFSHGITPDCLDFQKSIIIGDWCYIGSATRFVPGAEVPDHVFVGMGSVVTKKHKESYVLLAGVPATIKNSFERNAVFFDRPFLSHAHHLPEYDGNHISGD